MCPGLGGSMSKPSWLAVGLMSCAILVAGCTSEPTALPSPNLSTGSRVTAPVPDEKLTALIAECARKQATFDLVDFPATIDSGVVFTPTHEAISNQLLGMPPAAVPPPGNDLVPYSDPAYVVVLRGRFSGLDATTNMARPELWILIPRSALIEHPNPGDGPCVFDALQSGGWFREPNSNALGPGTTLPLSVLTRQPPA